jgi:O-antigen biosynthesis protein
MKATTRYGEFCVFTDSDLISRSLLQYGEWAQCEIDILGQFISRGDAVVDAGAYIGTHTVAFSLMVGSQGTVHSFEPNRHAKALLDLNVLANSPNNVTVHETALGETRSRAKIESGGDKNFGATRIHSIRKTAKTGIAVETLDSLQLRKLEFVKADVEGWEMSLVRGATATIASFRPVIFLECNSLQAILELPAWVQQNKYISYGLLVSAFNPRNFNESRENIFGPSKECGLLLVPKERCASFSTTLQRLNLPLVATIDDAALLLLHKPQYPYEILEKSMSAKAIGINYPSPALGEATSRSEIRVRDLDAEVLNLRGRLDSLTQSLSRDYAAKMADQEVKAERKIQEMTVQADSLTQTLHALRQEIQLQRASFYKKAHETSQAHVALERELQEELWSTQREIQAAEQDWAAKIAEQQTEAARQSQAMSDRVDALTQTIQSLQQEILSQRVSFHKETRETSQAHTALERQLREDLLSRHKEIEVLQRDWTAKVADQQAEAERKTKSLVMQIDALTQSMQSLQREVLLQKASFYKRAYETNQAHVALEKELQEELLSTQREIEAIEGDWAAKMADQQAAAVQNIESMAKQVASLTQSLVIAEQEQRRQVAESSERALEARKVREALEGELDENILSTQQAIETLGQEWAAKMAAQKAEAELKLEIMARQVDALTQSLLAAEAEQRRQDISHTERALETERAHSEAETELQKIILAARMDVEHLERAKFNLEVQKARTEASPIWRASETARKIASGFLGKLVPHAKNNAVAAKMALKGPKEQDPPDSPAGDEPNHIGEGAKINDSHELEKQEILESGLFDGKYYLSTYADVASANVDPLSHFINYGWKEGRNPSEHFETNFYLETYSDVKESKVNPLTHYVRFGKKEERKKSSIEMLSDISLYFDLLDTRRHTPKIAGTLAIDIVIPIYNGFDYLEPLFRSIFSNTSAPYRLIVVEDASPDSRVKVFLRELRRTTTETDILLIENRENLGFVGSVNKAVAQVRNHFVLLNSDTEVPPKWIERLMFPILEMDKVASTTPFTNSGTICSFPIYLKDNPLFENFGPEVIDSYFQYAKFESNYLSIPTGIGFCMGVNKRVVDEIGMFDEVFGKGYCEENDWSARAEKLGYRNLQVPNLFVYHKHGGSFPSEERKLLIERNHSVLLEKHPSYDTRVQEFIRLDGLKYLRQFLIMLLASNEVGAVLIFDNELGGGAHQFRRQRITQIVNNGEAVFLVSYRSNGDKLATLEFYFKAYSFLFSIRQPHDLEKLFLSLKVREIIVNSFVSFPNVDDWIVLTTTIRDARDCKLVFLAHDYFAVCPSYTLINDSNEYCSIPSDLNVCRGCLTRNTGDFRRFEAHADILTWRTQWEAFLQASDEIVCFSNSSADTLHRAYPSIGMERFVVRPHDISGRFGQIYFGSWKPAIKTIGVLGAINLAKGSNVVRDLVKYIDARRLPVKVVLFGEIDVEIRSASFEATGRYDIESLEAMVLEANIDVFLLPSIWPETFSFTADEIMQMGFPLIVFNLGAPAERVRNYPLGKVIEPDDLYKALFGDEVCMKIA